MGKNVLKINSKDNVLVALQEVGEYMEYMRL